MKKQKSDGTTYYYYYKKKLGRHKKSGRKKRKKYTTLRKNVLINSTRKYDDLGDWLYFRLMLSNTDAFIKAALGDKRKLDDLLDKMFYDYNDKH